MKSLLAAATASLATYLLLQRHLRHLRGQLQEKQRANELLWEGNRTLYTHYQNLLRTL